MAKFFEEFQEKKKKIIAVVQKGVEYEWLGAERAQEMIANIERDVLTLGVIGQMKCGKSTFLNAFVFEKDVLPAATTPMTAALSVITYGEKEKIEAEFYTKEEWAEQLLQSKRDPKELKDNELEQAKVQAAQELVQKSQRLGSELENYLGKTQQDSLENLIEYVGADGQYISITKAVKIYYPKDYLKGVEIVDTPGMNDPIVSREERTKEFLAKADVVLMMLYAGRPFDAKDRTILFEDVQKCGVGKVVIGINKYDIPYGNGETEEKIKKYVEDQIKEASKESGDEILAELIKMQKPISLAAEMALLSEIPLDQINATEKYLHAWERYCRIFEIGSQKEFREKSHIDELNKVVIDIVTNQKGEILLAKPKNALKAAASEKEMDFGRKIQQCETEIKVLETPPENLERMRKGVEKAKEKMEKKKNRLKGQFDEILEDFKSTFGNRFRSELDMICTEMEVKANQKRCFNKTRINNIKMSKSKFDNTTVPGLIENELIDLKRKTKKKLSSYFNEIESICTDHLEDFDFNDFLEEIKSHIKLSNQSDSNKIISNDISDDKKPHENVRYFRESSKNLPPFYKSIEESLDDVLEKVKKSTVDVIITPITSLLKKYEENSFNGPRLLREKKEEREKLIEAKEAFIQQEKEITEILDQI